MQGTIPSLTVQIDQTEILPPGYTVHFTQAQIVHVGQSISNLPFSVGDSENTSSFITITNSSVSD